MGAQFVTACGCGNENETGKAAVNDDTTLEIVGQDGSSADVLCDAPLPWKPLSLTIVSARSLRNADLSLPFMRNVSDPYCICEIENKPLSRTMTDVVRDNLDPTWNHESQFRDFDEGDILVFCLWDKDARKIKKDDFLGRCKLVSSQFWPGGFDDEIELEEAGKNQKAYLKVVIPPAARESKDGEGGATRLRPKGSQISVESKASYAKYGPSGNPNKPADYVWLMDPLQKLAANDAAAFNVKHLKKKEKLTPTLVVMGGCPNTFCGMQAVMFAVCAKKTLDFWWVKPSKDNPSELEKDTLNLHDSGKHKNDPGRSKPFYQPLADLFLQNTKVGDFRFGLEDASFDGKTAVRCVFRNEKEGGDPFYLIILWQEDFTTNPFSFSKYIKGKLVYQRRLGSSEYFYRQYEIHDGKPDIAVCEEGPCDNVIPPESIKELWDMTHPLF